MHPLTRSLLWIALALGATSPSHATNYVFTHTGFAGGATITGSFSTGLDSNNDGTLSTNNPGEITALNMYFSGNADVAAFSADMVTGSVALTFRPNSAAATFFVYPGTVWPAPFSWDSSSDGTDSPYFYSRVFGNTGANASYTDRATGGNWTLMAAPVPEPAMGALWTLGGLALLWRRRKARTDAAVGARAA
jgi:hypothetical protein